MLSQKNLFEQQRSHLIPQSLYAYNDSSNLYVPNERTDQTTRSVFAEYLAIGVGLPWALQASATSWSLRLTKALSESSVENIGAFRPTGSAIKSRNPHFDNVHRIHIVATVI